MSKEKDEAAPKPKGKLKKLTGLPDNLFANGLIADREPANCAVANEGVGFLPDLGGKRELAFDHKAIAALGKVCPDPSWAGLVVIHEHWHRGAAPQGTGQCAGYDHIAAGIDGFFTDDPAVGRAAVQAFTATK